MARGSFVGMPWQYHEKVKYGRFSIQSFRCHGVCRGKSQIAFTMALSWCAAMELCDGNAMAMAMRWQFHGNAIGRHGAQ